MTIQHHIHFSVSNILEIAAGTFLIGILGGLLIMPSSILLASGAGFVIAALISTLAAGLIYYGIFSCTE